MEKEKQELIDNAEIRLLALSEAVQRTILAARMGSDTFNGDRDIYQALGYPRDLGFADYAARYKRQDIAKAVIDRPADATWQGPLLLQESSESENTELETAFKDLNKSLGLKTIFNRVDKMAGLGHYAVLLLGLDDVRNRDDWRNPVSKGARKLMYVKPFNEITAKIHTFVDKPNNPRYGLPLEYEITISTTADGANITSNTVYVHYTRVIHIVDSVLENEIIGIPRLEAVYNRLQDLEKIVGGDAEMFWRSARPGFQGIVDKDYQLTPEMKKDLKEQIDEYEHNLRRMLVNTGIKYEALEQLIADPSNHVDIQVQMISTVTGIPKRILTGTERGELSSNQDASEWRSYVNGRRLDHAEPHIVRPFVDRCIELGILPTPISEEGEYDVVWSDLYAKSEADNVKIGMDRAAALRNYVTSPLAESVLSPEAFLMFCMGFDDNQLAIIKDTRDSEIIKETRDIMKMVEPPEPPKPAGSPKPTGRKPGTKRKKVDPAKK